jgi:hypothetical protein
MMQECGAADVVFEGVFHGSDLTHLPAKGYGYLNSHPMLIEVIAVEEVHRPSIATAKRQRPTDVTVSDLSLHPRRFNGHLVRVRAHVVFGLEGDDFLLDPFKPEPQSMPSRDPAAVWLYCKPEHAKQVWGRTMVADPDGRVLGTFTGCFHYVPKPHIVNGAFGPGPLQFEAVAVSNSSVLTLQRPRLYSPVRDMVEANTR